MIKVKNSLNANSFPKNYKVFTMPSETVPDQTMSMRTILERYARGLPIDGSIKTPIWDEHPEDGAMPDPRTLDLAERQEMAENAKAELEELKTKLNKKAAAPKPEKTTELAQIVPNEENSPKD